MDDRADRVAALLHEAGDTHHVVCRIVDGDDTGRRGTPTGLLKLSELPQILGSAPVRSELVSWLLVGIVTDYTTASPDTPWPDWYVQRILEPPGAREDDQVSTAP